MDTQHPDTLATARALPAGSVVGRYEIVRVLADTRVGIDYLAIDIERGNEVVLKEYLPQRLARRDGRLMVAQTAAGAGTLARGLQAFLTEAQLLSRVRHPALVRVLSVIEAHGSAYQVQAHRGGNSLLQVRQELALPPDEAALRTLLDGVLGALHALHHDGRVHGAVAPGNILLLADDRPLLLGPDLAGAEITTGLIESLMASVEPSFAAPEQRHPSPERPPGAWTDLYSLAATMRFYISGELPPPASGAPADEPVETMAQLVLRVCADPAAPRYSPALVNALEAALAPNPALRPRDVAAFRSALGTRPAPEHRSARPAPTRIETRVDSRFDSVPGTMSSPFIEPDPEPDHDHIVVGRAPRRAARAPAATARRSSEPAHRGPLLWAVGTFALLLVAALAAGWWLNGPAFERLPAPAAAPVALPAPAPDPMPPATPAAPLARAEAPAPQTLPQSPPQALPAAAAPSALGPSGSTPAVAPPRAEPPVTAPPPPVAAAPARPAGVRTLPASPRDACSGRTQFSLYRCMQAQCEQRVWANHPLCERLRVTDSVD